MIKTSTSNGRYSVDNIISILDTYTDEDLRRLNQAAYNILNGKRKETIAAKKRALCVGYTVSFDNGRKVGTIAKINRTKCVVDCGGIGNRWNVPLTQVSIVTPQ
jgi:hypothetical protein